MTNSTIRPDHFSLINLLMLALFAPEKRRLAGSVDRLCRLNTEATGQSCHSFLWNGDVYTSTESTKIYVQGERPSLAFSLLPEMEAHLSIAKALKKDEANIRQILFKLLYQCNDKQEMMDALPDCLHNLTNFFAKMQSQKKQSFILNGPRLIREYNKILPKIEMHAVARLIY